MSSGSYHYHRSQEPAKARFLDAQLKLISSLALLVTGGVVSGVSAKEWSEVVGNKNT